jgi:hypothetical protein
MSKVLNQEADKFDGRIAGTWGKMLLIAFFFGDLPD